MALVKTLSETPERAQQELRLQLTLGPALQVTQGFTAPEAVQAYLRARDLSEQLGEAPQRFQALQGLLVVHNMQADHDKAGELAEQLLDLAQGTRDPAHLLLAHQNIGATSFWRGEFFSAREHLEEVIRRYHPEEHRTHDYLWASRDPGVAALGYLSWTLFGLGYPDHALTRSQEALALARELHYPLDEAVALFSVGFVHGLRGEPQAALDGAEAVIALASEYGFPYWVGLGTFFRAAALAGLGQLQEGIAGMRLLVEAMRATGAAASASLALALLAEAHRTAGEIEEGLALVAEAQEFVTKTGERQYEAEMHRVKGELILAQSSSSQEEAEASFRKALDVARRQSAKSLELRAATSLARLRQQQGRKDEARELLAPVYDWFTEGFDTRDLKEAKALLDELA